jgi:hypothetical protein
MRVEVRDPMPFGLPRIGPVVPASTSGRGLLIVRQLTSRWGVPIHDGVGKTVWFEIDASPQ